MSTRFNRWQPVAMVPCERLLGIVSKGRARLLPSRTSVQNLAQQELRPPKTRRASGLPRATEQRQHLQPSTSGRTGITIRDSRKTCQSSGRNWPPEPGPLYRTARQIADVISEPPPASPHRGQNPPHRSGDRQRPPMAASTPTPRELVDRLDTRHEELIHKLDELNARIEATLAEFARSREQSASDVAVQKAA
jgi:hypothetical protein